MAVFAYLAGIFTLTILCLTDAESVECKDVTETDGSLEHVCSYLHGNLTEIPKNFPVNTTKIYLSGHSIKEIQNNAFARCPDLKFLDLSFNNITSIDPEAFNGTHLSTCLLNNNRLNFSFTSLLGTAFRHLDGVKVLDVSFNRMWETSPLLEPFENCSVPQYRGDLFSHLVMVESLTMDSLPYGSPFPQQFAMLTRLTTLNLRAKMTSIRNDTFAVFHNSRITSLTIWSGYLIYMNTLSFEPFTNLVHLDLSYNVLLGFSRMSSAWPGLASTQIQELVLRKADRFESGLVTIEASFFQGLENTRIKKLILDGNNIITVEGLFACYLPHLEYLSINRNRLVQVVSLADDIGRLANLTYFDASFQSQRTFVTEDELLTFGQDIGGDEVITCSLTTFEAPARAPPPEASASCEALPPKPLNMLEDIHFYLSPQLTTLNLSASLSIETGGVPQIVYVHNATSLTEFDYSMNGIQVLHHNLIMTETPEHQMTVNLSYNGCYRVYNEFLERAGRIAFLYLQGNKLGTDLSDNVTTWGDHYTDLRVFDLSDNVITHLPLNSFSTMAELELLDLSRNALRELPGDLFSANQNLVSVNLAGNVLARISKSLREALEVHANNLAETNRTLTIDLSGNPLECHCDTLEFLKWSQALVTRADRGIALLHSETYSCWYNSSLVVWDDGRLEAIIGELNIECTWRFWAIIGGVCFAFVVLVIACSVCIQRHKWDIRFYFLNRIVKKQETHKNNGDDPQKTPQHPLPSLKYDAYVSYEYSDFSWIRNELLLHIENHAVGLRLCLPDRDFLPGPAIEDNITRSMRQSRKVLLVVSNAFLRDNWRHLETELARIKSLDEGRNVIVPVLLDPIDRLNRDNISSILLNTLQKRQFLEWPRHPGKQQDFWMKLRNELMSRSQPRTHCQCGRVFYKMAPRFNALPRLIY